MQGTVPLLSPASSCPLMTRVHAHWLAYLLFFLEALPWLFGIELFSIKPRDLILPHSWVFVQRVPSVRTYQTTPMLPSNSSTESLFPNTCHQYPKCFTHLLRLLPVLLDRLEYKLQQRVLCCLPSLTTLPGPYSSPSSWNE